MKRTIALALVIALVATGCKTPHPPTHYLERSYPIGTETSAGVGQPFAASTQIDTVYLMRPIWWLIPLCGVCAFIPLFYHNSARHTTTTRELVYLGRDSQSLHVAYRETVKGHGGKDENKNTDLHYDLATSDVFAVQDMRVRVVEATNEGIRVVVLSDGKDDLPPPPKRGR